METVEIKKRPKNLNQFRKTLPAAEKKEYIVGKTDLQTKVNFAS